jgi:hypothetical protein
MAEQLQTPSATTIFTLPAPPKHTPDLPQSFGLITAILPGRVNHSQPARHRPAITTLSRKLRLMTIATLMSTSMTITMSQTAVSACPNCGIGLPEYSQLAPDAQKQIEDLQAQVRLLTQKATAAGTSLCNIIEFNI